MPSISSSSNQFNFLAGTAALTTLVAGAMLVRKRRGSAVVSSKIPSVLLSESSPYSKELKLAIRLASKGKAMDVDCND